MTEMSVYQLARKRLLDMPMNFAPPLKKRKVGEKQVVEVKKVEAETPEDHVPFSAKFSQRKEPTEEELAAMTPQKRFYYRHRNDPGFMEKLRESTSRSIEKAMKDPERKKARTESLRKSNRKRMNLIKDDPKMYREYKDHMNFLRKQSRQKKKKEEDEWMDKK